MSLGRDMQALARRAGITPGSVSWEEVRAAIARDAHRKGEWAGQPVPVKGMRMIIHPKYPFAESLGRIFQPDPSMRVCRNSDVNEDVAVLRNQWYSFKHGRTIMVWRDSKGSFFTHGRQNTGTMLFDTISAARSWDFAAELRAMETLKRHVTQWAYECYVMTGSFLETSPRSQVTYMFRRLRPTLALTSRPTRNGKDVGVRFLASLCAHPVGYFDGTWAGALVPTDDCLSHLLMMRADEHGFWRMCNQHPAWAVESGL